MSPITVRFFQIISRYLQVSVAMWRATDNTFSCLRHSVLWYFSHCQPLPEGECGERSFTVIVVYVNDYCEISQITNPYVKVSETSDR